MGASCFSPPGDMSMKNSKTKSTGETSNESVLLSHVVSPSMSARFLNLSNILNTETVVYPFRTFCSWCGEETNCHQKVISHCVGMFVEESGKEEEGCGRRMGAW